MKKTSKKQIFMLFGRARQQVLALLFGHPESSFYLREIIREAGTGASQVQQELKHLTQSGLILREKRANQIYFRANPDAPIFDELKSIVLKTFGVADVVRNALAPFRNRILLAFIYGSIARNEDTAASDIDLMIVGDVRLSEIVETLADAESRLRRATAPTIYSPKDFRQKVRAGDHFISQVLKGNKIFLAGTEQDIASVTEQKPAKS